MDCPVIVSKFTGRPAWCEDTLCVEQAHCRRQLPTDRPLPSPEASARAVDPAIVPQHYHQFPLEPLLVGVANYGRGVLVTKINKYLSRAPSKTGHQDIEKARRCLDMLEQFDLGNPWWWTPDGKCPQGGDVEAAIRAIFLGNKGH